MNRLRKKKEDRALKTTTKTPPVTVPAKPPIPPPQPEVIPNELQMEELKSYMIELHAKTENTVKGMVEACKLEINSNLNDKVSDLTGEMKSNR